MAVFEDLYGNKWDLIKPKENKLAEIIGIRGDSNSPARNTSQLKFK